jgi:hypothetical protein
MLPLKEKVPGRKIDDPAVPGFASRTPRPLERVFVYSLKIVSYAGETTAGIRRTNAGSVNCHRSELNQPRMVEMTQPVNSL